MLKLHVLPYFVHRLDHYSNIHAKFFHLELVRARVETQGLLHTAPPSFTRHVRYFRLGCGAVSHCRSDLRSYRPDNLKSYTVCLLFNVMSCIVIYIAISITSKIDKIQPSLTNGKIRLYYKSIL